MRATPDREAAARTWDAVVEFASFGFCKAHAAAFALPTYRSAWLKAHYPAHFLTFGILFTATAPMAAASLSPNQI